MSKDKPLVLVGGGGHARSLCDAVHGITPFGYVDSRRNPDTKLYWMGDDKAFMEVYSPDDYQVAIAVVAGADGSLALRRRLIERYAAYEMPTLTAMSAYIAPDSTIGKGCQLMVQAFINTGTSLGACCVVNTRALIEHDCRIGSNVFIGPGAIVCGGVEIGDDTFIGAGAVIRPGVKICSGAVVGLGAAVVKDIAEPGTYAGVPAIKL